MAKQLDIDHTGKGPQLTPLDMSEPDLFWLFHRVLQVHDMVKKKNNDAQELTS